MRAERRFRAACSWDYRAARLRLCDPQFIRRPVLRSRAALLWRGCHSGRQWLGCGKTMIAKLLVAVPEAFVAVMVTG
jgi:hypothetical protein